MNPAGIDPAAGAGGGIALCNRGFRIFFPGAGVFAIVSIASWWAILHFQLPLSAGSISIHQRHAHEMIYGYSLAVVAGFLLTAVQNWTGIHTLHGKPLALLFCSWAAARLLFSLGYLSAAGAFDLLFAGCLVVAVTAPIIKARQWRQLAVAAKLVLLAACNLLFYLGAFGFFGAGLSWGIYGGLYILLGLVLTIGRRVLPGFIARGVGQEVRLFHSRRLDGLNIFFFLAFFGFEMFTNNQALSSYSALAMFLVNAARLIGWYTPGIWRKSLLWSLYLSFWFICAGFLLSAGVHFWGVPKLLAVHAFAYGGIGVVTLSMMSRVTLGHTGRDPGKPPGTMGFAFGVLSAGAIARVAGPLLDAQHHPFWVELSQLLWIIAFLIFIITCLPMFLKPRVDGQHG